MTFLLSALGWLKLVPKPVWYALGIIAALLMLWHIHSGWEKSAYNTAYNAGWAKQKVQTDAEIHKNAINLKSITRLSDALDQKNKESDQRARDFVAAKAGDDVSRAVLAKQYASSQSARDALQAIAKAAGQNPSCKVPLSLSGALEGL